MKLTIQLTLILFAITLLSGCSGKNITLQDYADKWFNEKEVSENNISSNDGENSKTVVLEKREKPKKNPAADIAWSSTSKADIRNKGEGSLQKSLDTWTKEEWEPAFEGDINQSEQDKAANEHFTLQHYFDKAGKYMDKKERENEGKPKEPAHYEKMESLPVIGK